MNIFIVYNKDFTYYYIVTDDIGKYITDDCFFHEITFDELKYDIDFIRRANNE